MRTRAPLAFLGAPFLSYLTNWLLFSKNSDAVTTWQQIFPFEPCSAAPAILIHINRTVCAESSELKIYTPSLPRIGLKDNFSILLAFKINVNETCGLFSFLCVYELCVCFSACCVFMSYVCVFQLLACSTVIRVFNSNPCVDEAPCVFNSNSCVFQHFLCVDEFIPL